MISIKRTKIVRYYHRSAFICTYLVQKSYAQLLIVKFFHRYIEVIGFEVIVAG